MRKLRIISIFLIAASIYILYRSYEVRNNMSIISTGVLQSAIVENHDQKNLSITYSYNYDNDNFLKIETTDRETFINYINGDKILVYIDNKNPRKSIIKTNKVPISLLNFSFGSFSKTLIISFWYGIILGILMLGFGIYRIVIGFKKTQKTF